MAEPITIKLGGEQLNQEQNVQKTEQGKPTTKNNVINTAMVQFGKQALTQGAKFYGEATGDYIASEVIDTGLGIIGDVATIAVGGGIGLAVVGTKYFNNAIQSGINKKNADRITERINARSGIISTKGSRYGG